MIGLNNVISDLKDREGVKLIKMGVKKNLSNNCKSNLIQIKI